MNRLEQETIFIFNEAEKDAEVFTFNTKLINKLDDLCKRFPDRFKIKMIDERSKTYTVPKEYVSINSPRVSSEKVRDKRAKIADKARENR